MGNRQTPEQVQIWRIPLPLPEKTIARLNEWISPEERERIAKFHFLKDRQRYTSARGALRVILASCLGKHPRSLVFGYGPFGKPFLSDPPSAQGLEFNLSHCEDLAVIGVASRLRVGVDVEVMRKIPEMDSILERHFSREERASVAAAGPDGDAKLRLFLQFWTRREATAKAQGLDLSAAMSDLRVPPYQPGSGAHFEQAGQGRWSLQDLKTDPNHLAALCIEGDAWEVTYQDLTLPVGNLDH